MDCLVGRKTARMLQSFITDTFRSDIVVVRYCCLVQLFFICTSGYKEVHKDKGKEKETDKDAV